MIEFERPALPTDNYTMVPNSIATDPALNGNAVRLILYIVSRPRGWRTDRARIMEAVQMGATAFDAAVKKAEAGGWLERHQDRANGGRLDHTRYRVTFPSGVPQGAVTAESAHRESEYPEAPRNEGPGHHETGDRWHHETGHLNKTDTKTELREVLASGDDDAPAVAPEEEREDVERLLDRLDARITENRLRPPSRTKANRDAMRRLLDRDGYKEHQVAFIIDWAQNDEFWIPNVLSAVKLRKQFQTLVGQSMQRYNRGRAETAVERQSGWDDMAASLTAKGVQ